MVSNRKHKQVCFLNLQFVISSDIWSMIMLRVFAHLLHFSIIKYKLVTARIGLVRFLSQKTGKLTIQ